MEETAIVRLRLDTGNLPQASQRAATALAGIGKTGEVSARQAAAAMRQLPAQFTDIATSLAGGQNPLLVLLQQGGQIKDSFGGIGPALRGIGSAISPLTVGVGAVGAAVAALGLAQNQAAKEAFELQRVVTLNGTAAGLTTERLRLLTRTLDGMAGVTEGRATKALTQIAESSGAATNDLGLLTRAALELERAGGPAVEETAKALERLRREPLAATRELGTQLGYLTPALYDQVRALTEQGRTLEAASVAQRAYASAASQAAGQLEQALPPLQRGWRSLKKTVSEAWDAMVGLGRAPTVLERLEQVNAQLNRANQPRRRGTATSQGLVELGQAELASDRGALNRSLLNGVEAAEAARAATETAQAYATAREEAAKWATAGETAAEKLDKALKKLRDQVALIRSQGGVFSDTQLRQAEAAIRDQFKTAERRPDPKVNFDILDARDARVAALNAREAASPLAAFIDDQLNAQAARDDRRTEQAFEANARLLEQNEAFLQQLRDDNDRAAIELIDDERLRGEALIRLDADIARRRLDARAAAGEIGGAALAGARGLLDQRTDRQLQAFSKRLGEGIYEDTRGAIVEALRDTQNPVRGFVNAFGNLLYTRLVSRMADAMATALVGRDGGSGLFGGLLGSIFGASGGSGYTSVDVVPSGVPLATGTNYVPRDGMLARLHKGEAVVPAKYNPAAGGMGGGAAARGPAVVQNVYVRGDVGPQALRAMRTVAAESEARMMRRGAY